jgi:hypothetical protein
MEKKIAVVSISNTLDYDKVLIRHKANGVVQIIREWAKETVIDKIKLFERIESAWGKHLHHVSHYLRTHRDGTYEDTLLENAYKLIDAFFKDFCKSVREQLKGSEAVKNMLADITRNSFLLGINHPKIAEFEPFTYEAGIEAFDAVLDEYDANKNEGYWAGFWSTVDLSTMSPILWDTADVDIFWAFMRKRPRNAQGIYC